MAAMFGRPSEPPVEREELGLMTTPASSQPKSARNDIKVCRRHGRGGQGPQLRAKLRAVTSNQS